MILESVSSKVVFATLNGGSLVLSGWQVVIRPHVQVLMPMSRQFEMINDNVHSCTHSAAPDLRIHDFLATPFEHYAQREVTIAFVSDVTNFAYVGAISRLQISLGGIGLEFYNELGTAQISMLTFEPSDTFKKFRVVSLLHRNPAAQFAIQYGFPDENKARVVA